MQIVCFQRIHRLTSKKKKIHRQPNKFLEFDDYFMISMLSISSLKFQHLWLLITQHFQCKVPGAYTYFAF